MSALPKLILLLVTLSAYQSLTVNQNTYSVIFFRADTSEKTVPPLPVEITTSGDVPPGMMFENAPCHKPGLENCPAMAAANGIYLDGVPEKAGSYQITINAKIGEEQSSRRFTITVKASK
jgi:hypothetical protein